MDEHDFLAQQLEEHRAHLRAVALFGVPFDEIAGLVDRSPAAARQLASRARRRVQGAAPVPDADLAGQRREVDVAPRGQPFSVMGFTVVGGKIVEIDAITAPARLGELDLAVLDD